MGKHIKNERLRLMRQRERALEAFKVAAPGDYEKFVSATSALKELGETEDRRYANFTKPLMVIRAILEYEQSWLTPPELADLAQRGGYPDWDPDRSQALFVQSVRMNVRREHFQMVDGKVGLPDWKYPNTSVE